MPSHHFFRPTAFTVCISILLTLLAAVVLYATLLCALDASQGCHMPIAVQIFLIVAVWPMIVLFRLLNGLIDASLIAISGVLVSGIWLYVVTCSGRWIMLKLKRTPKESSPAL